jgi:hypothetical protein
LKVLNGEEPLISSDNIWDWLGSGIYFWEQNPARALEYAIECAPGKQKNKIRIKTSFVIGAIIELGNCLNLLEPFSLNIVKEAYNGLEKAIKESGEKMPVNKAPNRALDCAVIKYLNGVREISNELPFDTIRSSFQEEGELYPGSNFTSRLHIEICVRNVDLIKGYFLPMPIEDFNPYLNKKN